MQVKWFPCLVSLQVKVTWCQDACVPAGPSSFHRLRCRKWCHAWTSSEGHGSVLVSFSSLLVSEWGGNAAGGRRLEPRWRPAGMWTVSVLHQNLTLDSWTLIWKSNGLCVFLCVRRLERRWVLWHEFMKEHAHLDSWLRLAEQAVSSSNPALVTYVTAKDELRKFEVRSDETHDSLNLLCPQNHCQNESFCVFSPFICSERRNAGFKAALGWKFRWVKDIIQGE